MTRVEHSTPPGVTAQMGAHAPANVLGLTTYTHTTMSAAAWRPRPSVLGGMVNHSRLPAPQPITRAPMASPRPAMGLVPLGCPGTTIASTAAADYMIACHLLREQQVELARRSLDASQVGVSDSRISSDPGEVDRKSVV